MVSITILRVFNLLSKFAIVVYNSCLAKGIFPEQWKCAMIIMPIEKPGNNHNNAFDAARWPSIFNTLREFQCLRNLYNLAKSYFSARSAAMITNNIRVENMVMKSCPQGSCCGPRFWDIQYNSLLNLE